MRQNKDDDTRIGRRQFFRTLGGGTAAGGGWVTLVQGGTVGNRRLDRCERAETHVLRITMETVADAPRIRRVRALAG